MAGLRVYMSNLGLIYFVNAIRNIILFYSSILLLSSGLPDPEGEGIAILRNTTNCLPIDTLYNTPEELDLNQYHYKNLEYHNTYVVFVFKILRCFGARFLTGLYPNIM
jgi:hypothetical protein